DGWSMRLLSCAVILNIAAAPMLLSFACLDGLGLTGAHRAVALLVAATLAAGVALVIAQRSLGLLLLMLGGLGTVGLSASVLPMSNTYEGPPESFAMVVPVPVVLHKEDVKTLAPNVFQHIDSLSAPRLVEYWEQDPCAPQRSLEMGGMANGAPQPMRARHSAA